jgi:aminoglycoside 3-N-acetyltransferase I
MNLTVTRLTPSESHQARRLFALMAEVFGEEHEPPGDRYLADLLARQDFWAMAAFAGRELVGGLTAHALPMTRAECSELFIYDVAVRHDFQRRGVGRSLLNALRELAREAGIHELFVAADNADTHALDFYRALGGAPSPVTVFSFQ